MYFQKTMLYLILFVDFKHIFLNMQNDVEKYLFLNWLLFYLSPFSLSSSEQGNSPTPPEINI